MKWIDIYVSNEKMWKCNSENIELGSGFPSLEMEGIADWLLVYTIYTCKDCGYTEIVKKISEVKGNNN